MSVTHYNGQKTQIAIIPSAIYDTRANYFTNATLDLLLSYKELSRILYPEALFFYQLANNKFGFNTLLNDRFILVDDQLNNQKFIHDFEGNLKEEDRKLIFSKLHTLLNNTYGELINKYSMLQLILLTTTSVSIKRHDGTVYIFGGSVEISDEEKRYAADGKLYLIPSYMENMKCLLEVLEETIGTNDTVTSHLYKLYVQLTIQRSYAIQGCLSFL